MEASWMKSISSKTVCDLFYALYVVYAVVVTLTIISGLYLYLFAKLPKGMTVPLLLANIVVGCVAVLEFLFLYILCDRSIVARV